MRLEHHLVGGYVHYISPYIIIIIIIISKCSFNFLSSVYSVRIFCFDIHNCDWHWKIVLYVSCKLKFWGFCMTGKWMIQL